MQNAEEQKKLLEIGMARIPAGLGQVGAWLTGAEIAVLAVALARQERVRLWNLRTSYTVRSKDQRQIDARPWGFAQWPVDQRLAWEQAYAADPLGHWLQKMGAQEMLPMLLGGGLAGKSALLNRLIHGKRPLRGPPPKFHSYPAYETVEGTRAIRLAECRWSRDFLAELPLKHLDGMDELEALLTKANAEGRRRREAQDEAEFGAAGLRINQGWYRVVGANDAGRAVLRLCREMRQSPDGFEKTSTWSEERGNHDAMLPAVTTAHRLWPELLAAYAKDPVIQVGQGEWPAWTLRLRRMWGNVLKDQVPAALEHPFGCMAHPDPMDLRFAFLGLQVGASTQEAEPDDASSDGSAQEPVDQSVQRILQAIRGQNPNETSGGDQGDDQAVRSATAFPYGLGATAAAWTPPARVHASWLVWEMSREGWGLTPDDLYLSDQELLDSDLDRFARMAPSGPPDTSSCA